MNAHYTAGSCEDTTAAKLSQKYVCHWGKDKTSCSRRHSDDADHLMT